MTAMHAKPRVRKRSSFLYHAALGNDFPSPVPHMEGLPLFPSELAGDFASSCK
jgi:hypothetical protein